MQAKVSVGQILEFRSDTESMAKLRRLRLFASSNYEGKSRTFVEDDLLLRIADYEHEANKWGFEVREAALTNLFHSKTLLGAAGGSLAAVLAGSPAAALTAATAGVLFEWGKMG